VTVRREALVLVGLVLAVDVLFIAVYFGAGIERASDGMKLGFTVVWTVINLAVVVLGFCLLIVLPLLGLGGFAACLPFMNGMQ